MDVNVAYMLFYLNISILALAGAILYFAMRRDKTHAPHESKGASSEG